MREYLVSGVLWIARVACCEMKIVITGFMGCGKTRIARELARRLDLSVVDLDDRIIEKEGRSPAQLIV